MENLFKASSKNKTARVTFYLFEIAALVIGVILLVMGLANSINYSSFAVFIDGLVSAVMNMLILYGIGRVIDLLAAKGEKNEK